MKQTLYVIVPVYNADKYLARCIESIEKNILHNICIVAVDDGSVDNSHSILLKYKQIYNNIVLLKENNKGPSAARNLALDYVKKECNKDDLLTFVDADDYVEPDYFQKMIDLYVDNKCEIVCSSFYSSKYESMKIIKNCKKDFLLNGLNATKILLADKTIQSHVHCKLYKASLWEDVRFPPNIISMEDQATTYKVFLKANLVFISNYAGYHYWQEGSSICRSKMTNKKILDSILGYWSSVEFLSNLLKNDKRRECLQCAINGFFSCFLMMYPRIDNSEKNQIYYELKQFVTKLNKTKLIKKYQPQNKIEKIEKIIYLRFRFLYAPIFKIAKRII